MTSTDAAELAGQATERIFADLAVTDSAAIGGGVVVDSPPGAGKSTLVVTAATRLADAGERVIVIAQTNEQVDDLTERIAVSRQDLRIGRLCATNYTPSARLVRHPNVAMNTKADDLADCPVIIGTAHKWATVNAASWPWAIVDEAYQMRSDLLLQVAGLFQRSLFVGDPGQLDPFSTVTTER
ncbi:MAG TPA: AAA domain-containing protein, partial [Streptosporangiaceae bacterium]